MYLVKALLFLLAATTNFTIVGVDNSTINTPEKQEELALPNALAVPQILIPALKDERPVQIIRGSRFSGKSWFKALHFLLKCRGDQYFRGVFARHTQRAAKKSQFQLFKDTVKRYPQLKGEFEFNKQEMKITHLNGNFIQGGSFEDPESLMSVPDVTDFWAEEPITRKKSIEREAYYDIAGTLRNPYGIPPIFHFTFNCIAKDNFIYEDYFDPENKIYKDSEFLDIVANYWHNPFCPEDRIKFLDNMKVTNPKRYLVDGLGKWGEPITGDEYHHNYDPLKHEEDFGLRDDLPIHISFDFNSKPYMTLQVWQIVYPHLMPPEFRCLKAYSNKPPFNSVEATCEILLNDFEEIINRNGIYIYGDSSGKNTLPLREKRNFYEAISASLPQASEDRRRILRKNPLHIKRREYLNKILSTGEPFSVKFHPKHAADAVRDMKRVKVDANSGLWKEKETKDGVTYEKVGHHSDAAAAILLYHLKHTYGYKL